MPFETAVERKFRDGRARYGEAWVGEHPLYESVGEALDLVIYLRLARRGGAAVPRVLLWVITWAARRLHGIAGQAADTLPTPLRR